MHWEWRGFGTIDATVRERLEQLPLAYPTARTVTDHYLWTPRLEANIKIRSWRDSANLKFKRLHSVDAACRVQLWIEPAAEDHPFPLGPDVLATLARELGVTLTSDDAGANPSILMDQLGHLGVRLVTIEKHRRLFRWESEQYRTLVDWCEIAAPERVDSLGIEDDCGISSLSTSDEMTLAVEAVATARRTLEVDSILQTRTYLEAIAAWASGRTVADG
jgi:hypothetical protein